MKKFCADIGGTAIKMGIFEDNVLTRKWQIPTGKGLEIFEDLKEQFFKECPDADAAGMTVPAVVGPNGYLELCANIEGWADFYPGKELSGRIGLPVTVLNDANAAALGECLAGAAKQYNSIIMLTLGTGIGCGIVLNGKIWTGAHGIAGEVGHIDFNTGTKDIESVGSAAAMARAYGVKTAKEVFDAAQAGNPRALEVIDRACDNVGNLMSALAMIIDPEAFVIGGGISAAGKFLTDRLYAAYDRHTWITKQRTELLVATLGNDAALYGLNGLLEEP